VRHRDPDNQSQEKMDLLRVLGARCAPVPPKPYKDDDNYQKIAGRLAEELPTRSGRSSSTTW
jgi:cysteine synthase A